MRILKLGAAQNRLGLLALVLLEAYCVGVSSEAELVWTRTYGGECSDYARRLVQDGEDGFIVAGWTESFDAGLRDVYLLKIDVGGDRVWERTYGGSTRDEALDIVRCRDGGFVIAGRTGWTEELGARSEDALLAKIDREGNLIWNRTYGSNGTDSARCVVESLDGEFVFAGVTTHSADPYLHSESGDVYVVKTDGEGNLIWNRTYGGSGSDWANCMVTSSDGYVIGGITWSFSTNSYDVYLLKIDHAGEKVWEKAYGGSGYDEASSIVRSGDGRLIVAGETRSFGAVFADVYLLEIDNDGNLLWQETYGGPRDDYARCIIQSEDGGFVAVGATGDPNERQSDVYVLKIDAEGNKVWERSFGGAENDRVTCVVPSRDGGFVVVGTTSFFLPSPGFSEDILLMGIRVPPTPIPEFPETVLMLLCGLLFWPTIKARMKTASTTSTIMEKARSWQQNDPAQPQNPQKRGASAQKGYCGQDTGEQATNPKGNPYTSGRTHQSRLPNLGQAAETHQQHRFPLGLMNKPSGRQPSQEAPHHRLPFPKNTGKKLALGPRAPGSRQTFI